MSMKARLCALLTVAGLSLAADVYSQNLSFMTPTARIFHSQAGQPLSGSSRATITETVREFLRAQGHSEGTLDSLSLVSQSKAPSTGVTHARFVQRVEGLDVTAFMSRRR
jgi:hypothetical protein